eukprot:Rhum_TRINITY_DN14316_c3_g1::Rhum_TRINITY_DN14316_c3_g1_i1::g.82346::m.82346
MGASLLPSPSFVSAGAAVAAGAGAAAGGGGGSTTLSTNAQRSLPAFASKVYSSLMLPACTIRVVRGFPDASAANVNARAAAASGEEGAEAAAASSLLSVTRRCVYDTVCVASFGGSGAPAAAAAAAFGDSLSPLPVKRRRRAAETFSGSSDEAPDALFVGLFRNASSTQLPTKVTSAEVYANTLRFFMTAAKYGCSSSACGSTMPRMESRDVRPRPEADDSSLKTSVFLKLGSGRIGNFRLACCPMASSACCIRSSTAAAEAGEEGASATDVLPTLFLRPAAAAAAAATASAARRCAARSSTKRPARSSWRGRRPRPRPPHRRRRRAPAERVARTHALLPRTRLPDASSRWRGSATSGSPPGDARRWPLRTRWRRRRARWGRRWGRRASASAATVLRRVGRRTTLRRGGTRCTRRVRHACSGGGGARRRRRSRRRR